MIKPTPHPPFGPNTPPSVLFTVVDGISSEDLLVNLTETLASAHALTCDFAFDLEGTQREGALGIAQLIEVARLLAERVLESVEQPDVASKL